MSASTGTHTHPYTQKPMHTTHTRTHPTLALKHAHTDSCTNANTHTHHTTHHTHTRASASRCAVMRSKLMISRPGHACILVRQTPRNTQTSHHKPTWRHKYELYSTVKHQTFGSEGKLSSKQASNQTVSTHHLGGQSLCKQQASSKQAASNNQATINQVTSKQQSSKQQASKQQASKHDRSQESEQTARLNEPRELLQ